MNFYVNQVNDERFYKALALKITPTFPQQELLYSFEPLVAKNIKLSCEYLYMGL